MDFDDHRVGHAAKQGFLQCGIDGRERIVEGSVHEDPPQGDREENLAPTADLEKPCPPARRAFRIVEWSQDPRLALDMAEHLLLVEGVIAQRQAIGPRLEELIGDIRREAKA